MWSERERDLAAALALARKLGVLGDAVLAARIHEELEGHSGPDDWLVAEDHPLVDDPISALDLLGMAIDNRHIELSAAISKACGAFHLGGLPDDLNSLAENFVDKVNGAVHHMLTSYDRASDRLSIGQIDDILATNDSVTQAFHRLLEAARGRSAWTNTLMYACCGRDSG